MKAVLFTAQPNIDNKMFGHSMATDEKRYPNGVGYLYQILKNDEVDVEIYDRYSKDLRWLSDNFESFDFAGIYCWKLWASNTALRRRRRRSKYQYSWRMF